jgi:insulysin
MLFQGSAKYPANDHFDDYLSRNNGRTNAFTADTVTIFYFDVDNKAFMDGLDIFSHFFIDAKLDPAAVEREIFAVNNEYQIDLQKNEWRFMELLKKLSNKENPYHRFNIGNYKTLKTIPESMNLSVYDELRTFYETHYSSEKITVCVVSNETLDQLEALVTEKFSFGKQHKCNINSRF